MNQSLERKTSGVVVLALLLLGAILRFYQLDRTLGGGDENSYLLEFGDIPLKEIATTYMASGHAVFHTLLMRLMIMAFDSENAIAIRLPAFLPGIACLWMIYRVALQLFGSVFIARLSLLIAAICPIHVYYSQTARGYSLIMFFSIAMVYAGVKLLDSPGVKWGTVFVLCGALSVYTVITNVYFVAALAMWLFAILLVPRWREEHEGVSPRKKALVFPALFLLMALLSYLVYLPLLNQITGTMDYHLSHEQETSRLVIAGRVPTGTLLTIFPGPLIWFLPFLAVGMLSGNTSRPSYRLLPLFIFFLPLIVPLLSGVSGFPRNYLYNLPILVIFLSAGLAKTGDFLSRRLPSPYLGKSFCFALVALYVIASFKVLVAEHYPSLKMADGRLYQKSIRENSGPLDLIVMADSRYYLYARSVYGGNLTNIIRQNKLTGVKLISDDNISPREDSIFPFLKELINFDNAPFQPLTPGKKIFSLTGADSLSLLPEDFESQAKWEVISGKGEVALLENHKFLGKTALMMKADKDHDMVIRAAIDQRVQVDKPVFILLVWTRHGVEIPRPVLFAPMLTLQVNINGAVREMQLRMEKINNGINLRFWEGPVLDSRDWAAQALVGRVPPGTFTFNMFLRCKAGDSVIYDSFRLFFIEIPMGNLNASLQESVKTK